MIQDFVGIKFNSAIELVPLTPLHDLVKGTNLEVFFDINGEYIFQGIPLRFPSIATGCEARLQEIRARRVDTAMGATRRLAITLSLWPRCGEHFPRVKV